MEVVSPHKVTLVFVFVAFISVFIIALQLWLTYSPIQYRYARFPSSGFSILYNNRNNNNYNNNNNNIIMINNNNIIISI